MWRLNKLSLSSVLLLPVMVVSDVESPKERLSWPSHDLRWLKLTQPWPEMTQPAAQWAHSVNPDTGRWWPCSSSLALRCIYNLRAMMCAIMCGHNPYAITCGIKCHGWSSNGPSSIDLIFECTWCLLRMNGFWFNGKSIAQHERGKGALNQLLLPIFAITGVLPGHKWNTTQYRQNTMQYTSEIQLPLINAASLSLSEQKVH